MKTMEKETLRLAIEAMSRDFSSGVDQEEINKIRKELPIYIGGEDALLTKLEAQWWADLLNCGYKPDKE